MNHDDYMEVKFLIAMWERDMKNDVYQMSDGVKYAFTKLFKRMNSQQRWDTIDGNPFITQVLLNEGVIDPQFKPLFETNEASEETSSRKHFPFYKKEKNN